MTLLASAADCGGGFGIVGALVDESLVGLLLLDDAGAVVEANARGRQELSAVGGLCERNGRLCAHRREDGPKFDRILRAALDRGGRRAPCASVTLGAWPNQPPLTVYLSPLPGLPRDGSGVAAVVAIVDPWKTVPVNAVRVARSLGLTPAEGCVVASLAEGMAVCEIAAARKRSTESVRQLVKRALAKTWCSRQADLVRLALSVSRLPVPQG